MRFTLNDVVYDIDLDDLTTAEAELVEKHTGLGLWAFGDGITKGHPGAVRAVIYLARRRAGEALRWQDLDNVKIVRIAVELSTSLLRDAGLGGTEGEGDAVVPDPPEPPSAGSDAGTTPTGESPPT